MKKLIILFAFLLSMGMAKAQSKEETIRWIKEKIEKYPVYNRNIVKSIDSCKITVEQYVVENGEEMLYRTDTFPTTPTGCQGNMLFFNKEVVETRYQNLSRIEYKSGVSFFDPKGESELGKRMVKALNHLNTFCVNKKETF